jgi:hypothetical protein
MNSRKQKRIVSRALSALPPGSPRSFEYSQVESALARIYQAEHVQRKAFRACLKHFRKLGIPHKNPGKGNRVRYSASDIFQMLICLELSEFGIDPNLIVKIVERHWAGRGYFPSVIDAAQRFPGNDFYAALHANFRSWTWGKKIEQTAKTVSYQSGPHDPVHLSFPKESDLPTLLQRLRETGQRAMVFNLSARVRELEQALNQTV